MRPVNPQWRADAWEGGTSRRKRTPRERCGEHDPHDAHRKRGVCPTPEFRRAPRRPAKADGTSGRADVRFEGVGDQVVVARVVPATFGGEAEVDGDLAGERVPMSPTTPARRPPGASSATAPAARLHPQRQFRLPCRLREHRDDPAERNRPRFVTNYHDGRSEPGRHPLAGLGAGSCSDSRTASSSGRTRSARAAVHRLGVKRAHGGDERGSREEQAL